MYGLTEAFRSTYLDPAEVDRRPDSIGKAIPNAEILVVREDGTPCAPGEEGELVHRGALVALGYWNDPERTAERFRPAPGREAGLLHDRARRLVRRRGRAPTRTASCTSSAARDEMIKTSGYRVSPTEIEEVVYSTGLVRDAVALGVDDPKLGQHIVLAVSPANGHELDCRTSCSPSCKQQLPLYMVPKHVVVRPEPAAVAERQVRPQPAAPGARVGMSERHASPSRGPRAATPSAAIPLERLAARVGGTPFFAYDRALITERVELLRSVLPPTLNLSYAVKANPMPAVVQHLAGLVDSFDVASAGEMRTALDTRCRRLASASRARARRRPS